MTEDDCELDRLRLVQETAQLQYDDVTDWQARVLSDPLTRLEALHVSSVFTRMIEDHLMRHPAVLLRPQLFALASEAVNTLSELYQELGKIE